MLRTLLAVSLLGTVAGCKPAPSAPVAPRVFHDPTEVLGQGRFTVDVMELGAPRRLSVLVERLKAGAAKDPARWLRDVAQAKTGEPVAYDPALGLTKVEYDEFLALSKQMGVRKKSEATLTITLSGEGVYVLDGGTALPDLTGIQIDLKNSLVRTPLGVAKNRSEIHANGKSALGPWNGVQWKSDDENVLTVFSNGIVSLSLGILENTSRGVLYYRAQHLLQSTDITTILEFDLPAG